MKLAIISHTEHYYNKEEQLVGWGSTINEINHLLSIFEEIYHCAPLHKEEAPESSLPYLNTDRIKFVPLKTYGGNKFTEKFTVLTTAPYNIKKVFRCLSNVDCYQFRAPTGMGVYMIPLLKLFSGKPGWFKYAGNWMQERPPLGYKIQKLYLSKLKGNKVTINGRWKNQPQHCISFENPCLEGKNLTEGLDALSKKNFNGKLDFIFIGRVESAKGVHRIVDALKKIKNDRIGKVHLIGDGPEREGFERISKKIDYEVIFHGFLPRNQIFDLLAKSHIFLLPSDSEGFPKVLAEAANFGCVPIVSDISCLSDYVIEGKSGALVDISKKDTLLNALEKVLSISSEGLREIAQEAQKRSNFFTFDYYCNRIKNEIL